MRLDTIVRLAKTLSDENAHNRRRLHDERRACQEASRRARIAQRAAQFVQSLAQAAQQSAQSSIADIVTRCLEVVFDDPYTFEIRFEKKRNKTEAIMLFKDKKGNVIEDIKSATGGGACVDVAAYALRLAEVILSIPTPRPLICLDEPFKHVDAENQEKLKALIETLAEELGVQHVIVTHSKILRAGKIVEVK